tara:strand:+ start:2221 stop:2493 length:273 start_codon:yes stop_codon:yes gene_type:complete
MVKNQFYGQVSLGSSIPSYYIHRPYGQFDADDLRKLDERYEVINNLCIGNPKITLAEISTHVDVSASRVAQLINQYNKRFPDTPIIRTGK